VGICKRNNGGYCKSCLRNIPEILRWPAMSEAEKASVLLTLARRRARLNDPNPPDHGFR
jgi:predicted Fe-S protein YdhL (DUF1289 family)